MFNENRLGKSVKQCYIVYEESLFLGVEYWKLAVEKSWSNYVVSNRLFSKRHALPILVWGLAETVVQS